METDASIIIKPAANGFIVEPLPGFNECVKLNSEHVFQSFSELQTFLADHFTFRESRLTADQ